MLKFTSFFSTLYVLMLSISILFLPPIYGLDRDAKVCTDNEFTALNLHPIENSFYFVRHGRTDWNKKMIKHGSQDLSLNMEGIAEITKGLSHLLSLNITKIIVSPLRRCVESARIISTALGNIPVIVEPALRERYFGNWSMQQDIVEELMNISADGPAFFTSIKDRVEAMLPVDAELNWEFEKRLIKYFNDSEFNMFGENTLIIAHGCIMETLIKHLNISENTAGPKKYGVPIVFEANGDQSWKIYSMKQHSNEQD